MSDKTKTGFPSGKKKASSFPVKNKPAFPKAKPQKQEPPKEDTFKKFCIAWLKEHTQRFGEPKSVVKQGCIDIISINKEKNTTCYISVYDTKTVGTDAVEKIIKAIENKLTPDGNHRAVIMTSGSFSIDAQKAAVYSNVLLISGKTLAKMNI